MIGRIAREFGKTPLQLASEYGRASPAFLASLSPDKKILIDHEILNRLIQADNESQKKAMEEHKREQKMPGVKRMVSAEERSEQLREMRGEKRED
jgi:hypothetical protein